jgi:CHASE3 domain sensor protein
MHTFRVFGTNNALLLHNVKQFHIPVCGRIYEWQPAQCLFREKINNLTFVIKRDRILTYQIRLHVYSRQCSRGAMNWFRNLKVGRKVLLCCMVFLTIIVVLSGLSFYITRTSNDSFHTFFNDRFVPVRQLNRTARNMLQIRINMLMVFEAARTDNAAELRARQEDTNKLGEEYMKLLDAFRATDMTEQERKLSDDFFKKLDAQRVSRNHFETAIAAKDIPGAKAGLDEWLEGYRHTRAALDELIVLQQEEADKLMAAQQRMANVTYILVAVFLIISLIMGALITMLLAGAVSGPVNKGLEFAKKLAAGDFRDRIDLDQTDERGYAGQGSEYRSRRSGADGCRDYYCQPESGAGRAGNFSRQRKPVAADIRAGVISRRDCFNNRRNHRHHQPEC